MKTHPGVPPSAPCKVQAHDPDAAEGRGSKPAERNLEKQGEKEGMDQSIEKGDNPDLQPISNAASATDEPSDTSV